MCTAACTHRLHAIQPPCTPPLQWYNCRCLAGSWDHSVRLDLPVCAVAGSHPPTSVTAMTCNTCVHWPGACFGCAAHGVRVGMQVVLGASLSHRFFSFSLSLTWVFFSQPLTDIKAAASTNGKDTVSMTHPPWTEANAACGSWVLKPVVLKLARDSFFFFFLDVCYHSKYQTL